MSTTAPRFLPLGNLLVFSPLGLSFVDDFTGDRPIGFINSTLEVESSTTPSTWLRTDVRGLVKPNGMLAYPNLGRRGRVPTQKEDRNYRVTIKTQYYDPLYIDAQYAPNGKPRGDGIFFVVTPFDDNTDFTALKPTMVTLPLLPRANYPFAGNTQFLTGQVTGAATGNPIAAVVAADERYDATPANTKKTRTASDANGAFRIPLRWGIQGTTAAVTALDLISSKSGSIRVPFPYPFTTKQTITIPTL